MVAFNRESPLTSAPSTPAPAAPRKDRVTRGILYMIAATFLFAVSSAASKWQVDIYPIGEVLFMRSFVSLVACAVIILPRSGLGVFRTDHFPQHLARGVSQTVSQSCLMIAFSLMPLAGAIAINFSAPLFAVLIAALLLKEPVGPARWAALLVGFGGVLLVTNPGAGMVGLGSAFALANAVLYASVTVGVRRMTKTESALTLTMWQMVLLTAGFALLLPFGFIVPTWPDFWMMVFIGVTNALGQYLWTHSLHMAPTSAVSPFYYMSLVWALMLGYLVWGDVPTAALLAGSAVVVGSGLFLLWREARR
jgi:drug/metabolite transporter (DMT)-like permease